jgi:aspartyl-tRNA(Asn)/glutamyl-tRNA(Gln) amidotransferase subunit A
MIYNELKNLSNTFKKYNLGCGPKIYQNFLNIGYWSQLEQGRIYKDLNGTSNTFMLNHDLRLGIPAEYFADGIHPGVRENVEKCIQHLENQGSEIIKISLPYTSHVVATYYVIAPAEASSNLSRFDGIRYGNRATGASDIIDVYHQSREQGFGPEVKRRIILGTYVLSSGYYDAYYTRAQKVRKLITRDFNQAFEKVDAILSPVTPTPARRIGVCTENPLEDYLADIFTIAANLAGIPAISVPCGTTAFDGATELPVGIQIMAPNFGEAMMLRIAKAVEASA